MIEIIHIPKYEYETLCKDSMKLKALEAAGVNNWEWYDAIMAALDKEDN